MLELYPGIWVQEYGLFSSVSSVWVSADLESALRCITAKHPTSWSTYPPWVEYAHNSLTSSAIGMTPFMASVGFQSLVFPLTVREVFKFHLRQTFSYILREDGDMESAWVMFRASIEEVASGSCG